MIDDELITVLREQRGKVVMTTPVEQIISRGRAVRNRRRVPRAAAALGAAGAAAFAVSAALPAGLPAAIHPAIHPAASHPSGGAGVRLAAWTVTRLADGSIKVTFREATDPAGLQRRLRADGVPASVTFTGQQNPACRPAPPSGGGAGSSWGPLTRVMDGPRFDHPQDAYDTRYALVIHPSALPSGDGLQIWTSGTPGAADNFQLNVELVQASPQCTGS
jgi:hypothetical protein